MAVKDSAQSAQSEKAREKDGGTTADCRSPMREWLSLVRSLELLCRKDESCKCRLCANLCAFNNKLERKQGKHCTSILSTQLCAHGANTDNTGYWDAMIQVASLTTATQCGGVGATARWLQFAGRRSGQPGAGSVCQSGGADYYVIARTFRNDESA